MATKQEQDEIVRLVNEYVSSHPEQFMFTRGWVHFDFKNCTVDGVKRFLNNYGKHLYAMYMRPGQSFDDLVKKFIENPDRYLL